MKNLTNKYVLALFDRKNDKNETEEYKEIDLIDLESFTSVFQATNEFLKTTNGLIGNKSIQEWFEVNDISFWWFVYQTVFPRYNEAVRFIDQLFSFIECHPPQKLELKGCYNKINIIRQICKIKKIPLKISTKNYLSFLFTEFIKKIIQKQRYKKITKQKHKKRLELYENKTEFFTPPKHCAIVTSSGYYRRKIIDVESGETKKEEFFLQPILDVLNKNEIPTLCFDLDYTFKGETLALEERLEEPNKWVPIEIFLQTQKDDFEENSLKILRASIKQMLQSDIKDKFLYRDISFWQYVKPIFEQIFLEPYLPTYIHLIKKLEDFLKNIDPKVIIQIYETGPFSKAFEVVAKKQGIKTIGIQHGLIYDGHPDYMHKDVQNDNNPLGNPIPELMLVYGDYFKKILTDVGNYPSKNVAVIGNPAFYNIQKLKKSLTRNEILKKYNLPDKMTVLVPLTSRFDYSKDNPGRILLDILYDSLKDKKELTVLVRPRPGEPLNQSKLDKIYPSTNFKCSQGSLFEDIFVSDVVVTTFSTVGIDATIFEKPVIFADILGKSIIEDIQKYMIEHEVAISCSKDELISKIISIPKGILWKTEESSKRKTFMQAFFNYGKSVDLIETIFET